MTRYVTRYKGCNAFLGGTPNEHLNLRALRVLRALRPSQPLNLTTIY